MVRRSWCISILIIIPNIRSCSLTGPLCGWSAVVFLIVGIQASGISIQEVKFIDRDPHWYTRRVKEAIHTRLHPNNINRDSGIEIPEAWIPTMYTNSTHVLYAERPQKVYFLYTPTKSVLLAGWRLSP